MSEPQAKTSARAPASPERRGAAALRWARRLVNVITPLLLAFALVLAGWPRTKLEEGSSIQTLHDRLVDVLRKVSISQTWRMYAPDPARGHYYMVLETYDRDGTKRVQEESVKAETGWGTSWAWTRTRKDIWLHAIMRGIDKTNRNRTWYMRGVCMREARRGHDARRVSVSRVYRRIRPPDKVRAGQAVLGKPYTRKGQDSSCRVEIIRDMIALDRANYPEHYPPAVEGSP